MKIANDDYSTTGNKFLISEVYVYHGRDNVQDGEIRTLGDGKWNGQHLIMGLTHFWENDGDLYFRINGPPTSATDGKKVTSV